MWNFSKKNILFFWKRGQTGQNRAKQSQILKSRIILSKHAGYYILSFAKRDLPDCMDLLKKMDNLNWEKTRNCYGFHMSLHMMDEK